MARFIKGDVVVIPFPFSDLTQVKRRPALVLAGLNGKDLILCQITSRTITDSYGIALEVNDFISGSLNKSSNIRPNRLFTADSSIIFYKIGQIQPAKLAHVIEQIIMIFTT